MAGGMLTKQAVSLTAKFLNDVNDSAVGGQLVSVPSGVPVPPSSQTIAGDRIVLDDATALALSDTAVGTLFGGIYLYVGTTVGATQAPAVGGIAFWPAANIGVSYVATSDPQPVAATPGYWAGIFINAITKGNFGWIQIAGVANVLFDGTLTAAATASSVSAKVGSTTGTADSGAVLTTITLALVFGVSIGIPTVSVVNKVLLTRSPFSRV